jgi:hypothetical protein
MLILDADPVAVWGLVVAVVAAVAAIIAAVAAIWTLVYAKEAPPRLASNGLKSTLLTHRNT